MFVVTLSVGKLEKVVVTLTDENDGGTVKEQKHIKGNSANYTNTAFVCVMRTMRPFYFFSCLPSSLCFTTRYL